MFGMGTGGSPSLRSPRKREGESETSRSQELKNDAVWFAAAGILEFSNTCILEFCLLNIDGHVRKRRRVAHAVEIMVKPNGQLVTVSLTHY